MRLLGEGEAIRVQTRWKDRDGQPKIVEASHLSRSAINAENDEAGVEPQGESSSE